MVSMYLFTGEGPYSVKIRPLMETASRMLDALEGPFIIGADWQVPPEVLVDTQWPQMVGGVVRASTVPTCGDVVMDYWVVSKGLDDSVEMVRALEDAGTAPHKGSRLTVRGDARSKMVLKLNAPRPLDLPKRHYWISTWTFGQNS